jgi:hypothetical protein
VLKYNWWKKKLRGVQMLQINHKTCVRPVRCWSLNPQKALIRLFLVHVYKRRLTTHSVCICRQAQFFHLVTDSLKRSHPHGWFDGCVVVRSRDTMQLEKGRLDNGNFFCYAALTGLQINSYQQLNSTIATIGSCFCIRSPCN